MGISAFLGSVSWRKRRLEISTPPRTLTSEVAVLSEVGGGLEAVMTPLSEETERLSIGVSEFSEDRGGLDTAALAVDDGASLPTSRAEG